MKENPSMLIRTTTEKPVAQVADDLQDAVKAHGFGVLHVHNLKATLAGKGVDLGHECQIFEVCQPHHAKAVLEQHMELSTALPCRISVYDDHGQTTLATLRPTLLVATLAPNEFGSVAKDVEESLIQILEDAVAR